uniref:Uncharacterized protein n=1 Tax=Chromera velia CCMP2878 TaxID=1169474 RepID=A0A0G4HJT1_9ALVE|eukprot:Cvel_7169.t1-p1 / transcript=Cvel_7169.t1 / gene=Cvel_7169 / organism=Chromera_velia_CCMP2878 / gene_product=hypothetical protein / transcript_product=hypothetical protein / location=Cvel_scaffold369:16107-16793(-) / protein_length=229 / sequence_SO=supercontig / SO=protein_coding / is_pseudo=false
MRLPFSGVLFVLVFVTAEVVNARRLHELEKGRAATIYHQNAIIGCDKFAATQEEIDNNIKPRMPDWKRRYCRKVKDEVTGEQKYEQRLDPINVCGGAILNTSGDETQRGSELGCRGVEVNTQCENYNTKMFSNEGLAEEKRGKSWYVCKNNSGYYVLGFPYPICTCEADMSKAPCGAGSEGVCNRKDMYPGDSCGRVRDYDSRSPKKFCQRLDLNSEDCACQVPDQTGP